MTKINGVETRMSPSSRGKVYLIGAGPGDPGLMTQKGMDVLRTADVVVYDYLAADALLRHAREDAEHIYVGKQGFTRHITQGEINQILVDLAAAGKTVARLKGGDPFVFGRGGEEALALVEHGLEFEVIPGVTSGIAAPAYAGIPATHRAVATTLTFITGHEDPTKDETQTNWEALAGLSGTLCFYMGIKNLRLIAQNLMKWGKDPETPVALVRWGSTPEQETLVSTLAACAEDAERMQFEAPAIIVVGEVVALREQLKWFDDPAQKPLLGKRIVVTRSRSQASELTAQLEALGANVFELPTIAFEKPDAALMAELEAAVARLGNYQWLVLTSVNGVDAFFEALDRAGKDSRALAGIKVVAIGPATAKRIAAHGIKVDLLPRQYIAESVVEAMLSQKGAEQTDRVLIARAELARDVLPDALKAARLAVDVVSSYKTVMPEKSNALTLINELKNDKIDAITFTSSSTCSNFCAMVADALAQTENDLTVRELLTGVDIFSIGPVTSQTIADHRLTATAEAEEFTIAGLVASVVKHVARG